MYSAKERLGILQYADYLLPTNSRSRHKLARFQLQLGLTETLDLVL